MIRKRRGAGPAATRPGACPPMLIPYMKSNFLFLFRAMQINPAQGSWFCDCVGFTDYVLKSTPNARQSLRHAAGTGPGIT